MLDSIVGKSEWKQDWIYFTDDHKYWRFSKFNESYLIERELEWKFDTIFEGDKIKYIITRLDSINILLDNGIEKFHCKKWMPFDREDINRFLKADSYKRLINGKWIIDDADKFPIQIRSWCNYIGKGSEFFFNPNGRLEVFPIDTTNNRYCSTYSYSIHAWEKPELNLQETDFIIPFEIIKLNESDLILRDNNYWSTYKLRRVK